MRATLTALLLLTPSVLTHPALAEVPDRLGKKVEPFSLPSTEGKKAALADLAGRRATVIVFLSFECPVSNSTTSTLANLHRAYAAKGVGFLAVNSSDATLADLKKEAAAARLPFPLLKDDGLKLADGLGAKVVPEAFVLDAGHVLRYRGRIDNTWSARLKRNPQTTSHDLKAALDEVLAGKPVTTPSTRAVGCAIPRPEGARVTTTLTYHKDVLPILQTHCQQCHRPDEVAPFALMTYQQAVNWADDIKQYAADGRMPPWKVTEGGPFHNDRRLSAKEIAVLAAWADGGRPEGDPKDAPAPRKFTDGWQLGKPDLILTVPEDVTVGATGKDLFRCFVLPTGLGEDRNVVAFEVRPGNKRVVHHALNFFDASGRAREMELKERDRAKKPGEVDRGPGYPVSMGLGFIPQPGKFGGLGGWAPGHVAYYLPEGFGYPLPKGADVVMQLHYHRTGREEKDRTQLGLYFAKKPVSPFKGMVIPGLVTVIAPGTTTKVKGSIEVLEDCDLHWVMPHMHMIGRSVNVTLTQPGGQPQTLLTIPDWDYNWQETYHLKERLRVRKGARLAVEARYDNTTRNPNNPFNPPRWITFGEQTDNEMCFVFLGATSDGPGRSVKFRPDGTPTRPKPPEEKPGEKPPEKPMEKPMEKTAEAGKPKASGS